MAAFEQVWTPHVFRLAGYSMMKHFGPYPQCEFQGEDWEKWCEAFATVIGSTNGKAVSDQIKRYMRPIGVGHRDLTWKPRLLGLAAALESEWLTAATFNQQPSAE